MKSAIPFKHVTETGSTNEDLLVLARSGALGPRALLTDHQTAGRGRLSRIWETAEPNDARVQAMMGSVRLDWPSASPDLGLIPFVAGMALWSACSRPKLVGLKWPNDLVAHPEGPAPHPKLAGILVEAVPLRDSDQTAVVIGAGLNLWPSPVEGAASLSDFASHVPSNIELFEAFLSGLNYWTDVLRDDPRELIDRYSERCVTLGRQVSADHAAGRAVAIAADGSLRVEDTGGRIHTISAGDVAIHR